MAYCILGIPRHNALCIGVPKRLKVLIGELHFLGVRGKNVYKSPSRTVSTSRLNESGAVSSDINP